MPTVTVKAEIPEGYELACDEMRPARYHEDYLTTDGYVTTWTFTKPTKENFIIVRKSWQWPSWLTARWLYRVCGQWWASNIMPRDDGHRWQWTGEFRVCLGEQLLDFTPPPCEDDRTSLRENPNWKVLC